MVKKHQKKHLNNIESFSNKRKTTLIIKTINFFLKMLQYSLLNKLSLIKKHKKVIKFRIFTKNEIVY